VRHANSQKKNSDFNERMLGILFIGVFGRHPRQRWEPIDDLIDALVDAAERVACIIGDQRQAHRKETKRDHQGSRGFG